MADSAEQKRDRMKHVCGTCHRAPYVAAFYAQYDGFIVLFDEKFARPGLTLINQLYADGLLTRKQFDERLEWEWSMLWHHEARSGHGTSMMAPDYSHWTAWTRWPSVSTCSVYPGSAGHRAPGRRNGQEGNRPIAPTS